MRMVPAEENASPKRRSLLERAHEALRARDPTFARALPLAWLLSLALYARPPSTDFVFDEREALLKNPYVRAAADPASTIGWLDAFARDFWGHTADRTVGTYRPLPNFVWRALWTVGLREQSATAFALANALLHGLNGALVVVLAFAWTRDRLTAWLAGGLFVATAVVTEAVSGIVGLADVLAGTAALLALLALRLPARRMPPAVFGATLLGLFCKESALCIVPLVPLAVLCTERAARAERPRRWARAIAAGIAAVLAFVLYVELRRRWFHFQSLSDVGAAAASASPAASRAYAALLGWYGQPTLRIDPLDNPLAAAAVPNRVAGALRVYADGLGQLLLPRTLSADYSAQQEAAPREILSPGSALGAVAMVLPLLAMPFVAALRRWRPRSAAASDLAPVVAFALAWIAISFFPVSNIAVVLPTARAERFWYLPAVGSAIALAVAFRALVATVRTGAARRTAVGLLALFAGYQALAARRHALDYRAELAFWRATSTSSPRSAKAHLNYAIALGEHGDLERRLAENDVARSLAPRWAMAIVYEGETLCRLHRPREALHYYVRGLDLAANDAELVVFGLACLSDEHDLVEGSPLRAALLDLAARQPGSRLAPLVAAACARASGAQ